MPLLLRTVRQNRWHKDAAAPFLAVGDVPADPIADLNTLGNRISVFEVVNRAHIERIVRAVAVGRDRIADMGWVLFEGALLPEVEAIACQGTTADEIANDWHRDLCLSGVKLVALARAILTQGESGTVLKGRLRELVEEGIRNRELRPDRVKVKLD